MKRNDRPTTAIFSSFNKLKSRRHKKRENLNVVIMVAGSPNCFHVPACKLRNLDRKIQVTILSESALKPKKRHTIVSRMCIKRLTSILAEADVA
jgi:hypothetical protein